MVVCGLGVVCGLAVVESPPEDSVVNSNKRMIDRYDIVGRIVHNIADALYLNRLDLLFKHGSFVPADVRYREKSLALHADQPTPSSM